MRRIREWWGRRRIRPFDWQVDLPELRGPKHVRVIMPMGGILGRGPWGGEEPDDE